MGCWRDGEPCRVSSRARLIDAMLATGFPADRATSPHNNFAEFVHLKTRVRALRRCGSAALDLAFVADGTYDAFWEYKLAPWDTAAGSALVLAAGGRCAQPDGGPHDVRLGELVASNGHVHDALLKRLAEARRHPSLGSRN